MHSFTVHTPDTAPADASDTLHEVQRQFGFIPNLIGVLASAPAAAKAYVSLYDLFGQTSLTSVERQLVLATVSVSNQCSYCVAAHSWGLTAAGADPDVLDAVRADRPLPDPRLGALRHFVIRVVETRAWLDDGEIDTLLDAGYRSEQVFEILIGVALKTLSNYTNHMARPPLDAGLGSFAWEAAEV